LNIVDGSAGGHPQVSHPQLGHEVQQGVVTGQGMSTGVKSHGGIADGVGVGVGVGTIIVLHS
jgi:hypothetical protein